MTHRFYYTLLLAGLLCITFSCEKNHEPRTDTFYGQWQTSYGEVISFENIGGRNVVSSVQTGTSFFPAINPGEYRFKNGKLELSLSPAVEGYQTLQSFNWVTEGSEFRVQGVEWHAFLSSTLTTYTFKKL